MPVRAMVLMIPSGVTCRIRLFKEGTTATGVTATESRLSTASRSKWCRPGQRPRQRSARRPRLRRLEHVAERSGQRFEQAILEPALLPGGVVEATGVAEVGLERLLQPPRDGRVVDRHVQLVVE